MNATVSKINEPKPLYRQLLTNIFSAWGSTIGFSSGAIHSDPPHMSRMVVWRKTSTRMECFRNELKLKEALTVSAYVSVLTRIGTIHHPLYGFWICNVRVRSNLEASLALYDD